MRQRRAGGVQSPTRPKLTTTAPVAAPKTRVLWLWICLGLVLATVFVYAEVRQFDFVNFDDPQDVFDNSHVRRGLTGEGVRWAFTSAEDANWMPLTRLSHLLDVHLFGLKPGMHHLTNLALHIASTLLLFGGLRSATGSLWRSGFVAAVFALHPLHVESVAWVTERKDVLYAVFWFAALWAYVRYVRTPKPANYAIVAALFVLGLMSKPMMVTLPAVLLVLDVWPLRRVTLSLDDGKSWRRAVIEKLPLFGLAAASGVVTFLAQQTGGAVMTTFISFPLRVANALTSYLVYIGQTLWPSGLAVFYPFPRTADVPMVLLAVAVLAAVTWIALRRRDRPYLAAGWFWYLGTLVPVIGLVQVGGQARADRYTYVPIVGLAIIVAWGAADLVTHRPSVRKPMIAGAALACALMSVVTAGQLESWRNTETLYTRALAVTRDNNVAHDAMGHWALRFPNRVEEAIQHFEASLRINPKDAEAQTGLGVALTRVSGRTAEALEHLEAAVRIRPNDVAARNNLGTVLIGVPGRLDEAIVHLREAVRLRPDFTAAHVSLAAALSRSPGRLDEAVAQYMAALRLEPDLPEARFNLGALLATVPGRENEAVQHLQTALSLSPDAETHYQLATALAKIPGRGTEALTHLESAVRMNPASAEAHFEMARLMAGMPGKKEEAIGHLQAALRVNPEFPGAKQLLATLVMR